MKVTFTQRLWITAILVVIGNVLTEVFHHWAFRSAAWVICGLLYILRPVLPKNAEDNKKTRLAVRIAGVILILIGVFTRVHY